jgi:hypothetical protein
MVTTAQEYFANLDLLQNVNQPAFALLPSAENVYHIDVNTRTIAAPQFLSIEKDYKSETIYFAIDRYVNYMDLSQTCCVIQYNNANTQEGTRFYPVPFYDVYKMAYADKIVFPWCLDAHVTGTPGTVEFSIRFFKIGETLNERNEAVKVFTYNLNTLPAKSEVLSGFKEQQMSELDEYYLKSTQYDELIAAIAQINYLQKLRWTILDDSFTGSTIDTTQVQADLNRVLDNAEDVVNNI